jgi:hypothetical protein
LLGQVSIATANNGNIYVLGSVDPPGSDPLDVMFIRSTNGGAAWSSPIRINDNPLGENSYQWFAAMSVARNGRIDAILNDTVVNSNNHFSVLKYAYSADDGLTWLGNTALTPAFDHTIGYPSQNKIGDYYDIVSDNLGANVAFSATFNGGQDVYYMRITAVPGDFNGDGRVDAADYVAWRKDPAGHGGNPAGYQMWRQNFGKGTSGSGTGFDTTSAIPEPASLLLIVLGVASVLLHCNRGPEIKVQSNAIDSAGNGLSPVTNYVTRKYVANALSIVPVTEASSLDEPDASALSNASSNTCLRLLRSRRIAPEDANSLRPEF